MASFGWPNPRPQMMATALRYASTSNQVGDGPSTFSNFRSAALRFRFRVYRLAQMSARLVSLEALSQCGQAEVRQLRPQGDAVLA